MTIYRSLLILTLLSTQSILFSQEFRVLLAAYVDKVSVQEFVDAGFENIYINTDQNNIYRYFLGDFHTREEAEKSRKDAVRKGFRGAQLIDMEEQRALCGTPCPYISSNSMFIGSTTEKLYLRSIQFDHEKSVIKPQAVKELDKIYEMLSENSQLSIQLIGHTESKENEDLQINISKRRLRSVRNYLVAKGIPAYRIRSRIVTRDEYDSEASKFARSVIIGIIDGKGQVVLDPTVL